MKTKDRKWSNFTLVGTAIFFLLILLQSHSFAQEAAVLTQLQATPAATEGPYWKSGSPQRDTLYRQNDSGERIKVIGRVLSRSGKAINGAKIDIWQTDGKGNYDNSGYGYRGHVFSDTNGNYSFKTVKPGLYPSRTSHIHIKIDTPDGKRLTTQLYFPDYSNRNKRDYLFDERLSVVWKSKFLAVFDFVL